MKYLIVVYPTIRAYAVRLGTSGCEVGHSVRECVRAIRRSLMSWLELPLWFIVIPFVQLSSGGDSHFPSDCHLQTKSGTTEECTDTIKDHPCVLWFSEVNSPAL